MLALDLHPFKDFKMNRIARKLLELNGFFAAVKKGFSHLKEPLFHKLYLYVFTFISCWNKKIKKSKILIKD